MNNYEIINLNEWKRKVHFQVFRDYIEPSYCCLLYTSPSPRDS